MNGAKATIWSPIQNGDTAIWIQLFSIIGSDVPKGVEGTNPATMYNEPVLRKINTQLK